MAKAANFSPGHDDKLPTRTFQVFRNDNTRPLQNAPFRSLRLSAQSLRCVRILILEIFNIFLWLKSSRALILNEIEHFSKVSIHFLMSRRAPLTEGLQLRL